VAALLACAAVLLLPDDWIDWAEYHQGVAAWAQAIGIFAIVAGVAKVVAQNAQARREQLRAEQEATDWATQVAESVVHGLEAWIAELAALEGETGDKSKYIVNAPALDILQQQIASVPPMFLGSPAKMAEFHSFIPIIRRAQVETQAIQARLRAGTSIRKQLWALGEVAAHAETLLAQFKRVPDESLSA
jgi:hypothetical protein